MIMFIFNTFNIFNTISFFLKLIKFDVIQNFLIKTYFLSNYYILNEWLWQEGLMFDFLQKKIVDNWIKKFIIYSANLFSERLLFEKIIRIYLDLLIWPLHKIFIFEFNNVSGLLFINIFIFFISFFIFGFVYFLI